MMDGVVEVPLPFSVDRLIEEICVQRLLPMPDVAARKALLKTGEESAIDVLKRINSTSTRIQNLSGFIVYMVNKYGSVASNSSHGEAESICLSSQYPSPPPSSISSSPRRSEFYDSPTSKQFSESPCCCKGATPVITQYRAPMNGSHGIPVQQQSSALSCSSLKDALPTTTIQKFSYGPSASHNVSPCLEQVVTSPSSSLRVTNPSHVEQHLSCSPSASHCGFPVEKKLFAPFSPPTPNYLSCTSNYKISQQSLILSELEFRKLFMVHSYIGSNKLEVAVSVEDAIYIKSMKTIPMLDFEDWMWSKFGRRYCQPCDRAMYLDWDSGKTHLYSCYVCSDGGYQFKWQVAPPVLRVKVQPDAPVSARSSDFKFKF